MQPQILRRFALPFVSPILLALAIQAPGHAQFESDNGTGSLLDDATCQSSTSKRYLRVISVPDGPTEQAIARQIYPISFFLTAAPGHPSVVTCRIDNRMFDTLSLQMGVPEGEAMENPNITVHIYQSGQHVYTADNIVVGAQPVNVLLNLVRGDMQNPDNISMEVICESATRGWFCNLSVIRAELEPTPNRRDFDSSSERATPNSQEPRTGGGNPLRDINDAVDSVEDLIEGLGDLFN